jgi:tRNA pseudouridine55 synthase
MHGQRLALGKEGVALPVEQGRVRVYSEGAQLLGTGQIKEFAVLAPERLVNLFPSL